MTDAILTINAGSSSIKFGLYAVSHEPELLVRGMIAGIGRSLQVSAKDKDGQALDLPVSRSGSATHEDLTGELLGWIEHYLGRTPIAAGHRVVHGGRGFAEPVRINEDVMAQLEALSDLAPQHQPHNLAAIRAVAAVAPGLPQVACFDTAFHRSMPRLSQLFALPRSYAEEGLLRYGFHGLSYKYIAHVLPRHLDAAERDRVIVAHLGNGASLCALKGGQSVATSMGFTALDGLMMGRRCGSLDPGLVLHLIRARGMSAEAVEDLLYNQSGLYGVSGISNAMQVLEADERPEAAEAIALFCACAASSIAALVPALGGLDALIFTAGIGENSARVRREIVALLGWLGAELDPAANQAGETRLSTAGSAVNVLRIPTDEEIVIARAVQRIIIGGRIWNFDLH